MTFSAFLHLSKKKELQKIGNMAALSKGKTKKKWRSILITVVVRFNLTWILDKSYRKSSELYFRVADCRSAINTMKSFTYLGLRWFRMDQNVRRGAAGSDLRSLG